MNNVHACTLEDPKVATKTTDSGERPSVSVQQLLREMDRRYGERFTAQEKAVEAALTSSKEAIIKAEGQAEKRFEALNELRGVVSDTLARALSRVEAEAEFRRIGQRSDEHAAADLVQHGEILKRLETISALLQKMTPLELHFELDKRITAVAATRGGEKDSTASWRANVAMIVSFGMVAISIVTIILRVLWPK